MDIIKTLNMLNDAFGPSGREAGVREVIADLAKPFCDEMRTDVMGNLICHKKGEGKRIMFAAHMDSLGLMVTHLEKEGQLRFDRIGWLPPTQLLGTPVRFENGVKGVVYCDEIEDEGKAKLSDMFIDIGATSAEEAATHVRPGDMAVYDTRISVGMNETIIAPYMDNRSGCAVLLMAMEMLKKSSNDLYFVFTVQEEVGLRGAKTASFGIDPDIGIAVDVTGDAGIPKNKHHCSSTLGKGAAIKVKDGSVISNPELNKLLVELAEKNKIPYQMDILAGGGTDAGAMSLNMEGVAASGISVPCRFVHCPQEMVSGKDMENCAKLCAKLAEHKFK